MGIRLVNGILRFRRNGVLNFRIPSRVFNYGIARIKARNRQPSALRFVPNPRVDHGPQFAGSFGARPLKLLAGFGSQLRVNAGSAGAAQRLERLLRTPQPRTLIPYASRNGRASTTARSFLNFRRALYCSCVSSGRPVKIHLLRRWVQNGGLIRYTPILWGFYLSGPPTFGELFLNLAIRRNASNLV